MSARLNATATARLLDALHDSGRFRRRLIVIGAIGLLVRVAYVVIVRRDNSIWGDTYFYHHGANVLAEGEGFINPLYFRDGGIVEQAADHPPLYIVYLAAWSLLGVTSALGHMLVSTLIGTATVIVAGILGREVLGPRAGLLAAGLVAIYPNAWSYDGMMLSESLALLLATSATLVAYRYRRTPRTATVVMLGALVGLAALSRAELLLLSAIVVLPLVLGRTDRSWTDRIRHLALAGAACVGVLAPWVTYNMSRFDEPVLLSAGFEITLSTATCDHTYYGDYTGYWSMLCPQEVLEERNLDFDEIDQSERSAAWRDASFDYIRDNVDRLPYVVLARWGRITGLYRPLQQAQLDVFPEGRERWVAYSSLFSWYALAALAIAGGIALRRRRVAIYPLLGPLGVVFFAITVTFATNRYRANAEAVLCVLAAAGIDAGLRLYERLRDDPDDRRTEPAVDDGSGPENDGLSADGGGAARDLAVPTT